MISNSSLFAVAGSMTGGIGPSFGIWPTFWMGFWECEDDFEDARGADRGGRPLNWTWGAEDDEPDGADASRRAPEDLRIERGGCWA